MFSGYLSIFYETNIFRSLLLRGSLWWEEERWGWRWRRRLPRHTPIRSWLSYTATACCATQTPTRSSRKRSTKWWQTSASNLYSVSGSHLEHVEANWKPYCASLKHDRILETYRGHVRNWMTQNVNLTPLLHNLSPLLCSNCTMRASNNYIAWPQIGDILGSAEKLDDPICQFDALIVQYEPLICPFGALIVQFESY